MDADLWQMVAGRLLANVLIQVFPLTNRVIEQRNMLKYRPDASPGLCLGVNHLPGIRRKCATLAVQSSRLACSCRFSFNSGTISRLEISSFCIDWKWQSIYQFKSNRFRNNCLKGGCWQRTHLCLGNKFKYYFQDDRISSIGL